MGSAGHFFSMSRLLDDSLLDHPYPAATVAEYLPQGSDRSQRFQGLALYPCNYSSLPVSVQLDCNLLVLIEDPRQRVLCDLYPLLLHPDFRRFLRCPK